MRAGHYRARGRRRLTAYRRENGIPIRREHIVVRVEPELAAIPDWARKRAIAGLSVSADYVWLDEGDARILAALDRECGGRPQVQEAEFRRCKVCNRPLIGDDATTRRLAEQAGRISYMLPCSSECYEAQRDGRWRRRNRV